MKELWLKHGGWDEIMMAELGYWVAGLRVCIKGTLGKRHVVTTINPFVSH